MTEEIEIKKVEVKPVEQIGDIKPAVKLEKVMGPKKLFGRGGPRRDGRSEKPRDEFDQKVLEIRRVTRVTGGGKRFSFRAAVIVGNRKGKVGFGIAKGFDVTLSVEKAVRAAKKNIIIVPIIKGTIPHEVAGKYKAGKIILKPSPEGRGIIAGGAMRPICDLAGFASITGKIIGKSTNKINVAKATLMALSKISSRKV